MPRKDRRFTGDDLRRLYCKNLTYEQQQVFDAISCDDYWDLDELGKVVLILEFIVDYFGPFIELAPYGNYVVKFLDWATWILKVGDKLGELPYLQDIDYFELPIEGELIPVGP